MKIMLRSFLSTVLFLFFCSLTVLSANDDKVLLRYKWNVGEKIEGKIQFEGEIKFTNRHIWKLRYDDNQLEGKPKKVITRKEEDSIVPFKKEQLYLINVLSTDKEGAATVSIDIKTAYFSINWGKGEKVTGPGEWMVPVKGRVSELGEVEASDPSAWKKFSKEKVRAHQPLDPTLLKFPIRMVGIGDEWVISKKYIDLLNPVSDFDYDVTYRLSGFKEAEGKRYAIIISEANVERDILKGEWHPYKKEKEKRVELKDLKMEFRREYLFDIQAGQVVQMKGTPSASYNRLSLFRHGKREWCYEEDIKRFSTVTTELINAKTP